MPIDTAELMKKVRGIRILTGRLVDDRLAGDYHSAFKGQGLEFDEIRAYVPGDDVRSIDWNVTARTGFPQVKRFAVNAVAPGPVLPPADADLAEPAGPSPLAIRPLPADVAAAVVYLAGTAAVTGQTLYVDSGQHLL